MKRIILFFAVCLGLSVSQTTFADDADTVRTASKRTSVTTVSTQQSTGRTITSSAKRADNSQNASKNTRTAVQPQQRVTSRTTTTKQTVKARDNSVVNATTQAAKRISTASRVASSRAINSRQNEQKTSRSATSAQRIKHVSRATELNNEKITNIKSLNYSKCKTVYYECMDEFCANKDTDLRRCACSSRIHEFDNIKKQLSNVEDKMLDFNQRLLTVSLDKEDAAAINVATEGELAFATKDTSASEKILRSITDSLNNSDKSKINNDLSAISLSLNVDTAWDTIDSTSGTATSAKSGLDLYNAATPICIEMAREVCSDEELDIAQNGYKLTIQQDCDTVAKSYKTQYNSAMEKIHESSALLDMSRLNLYQQHNSDNTLTCKKKILDQLSDTSVCGENLYKCLDMSGQYVDPSTGKAFLSEELSELASLLKEPSGGETWSKVQQNEKFVKFLESKKKFLEPATKQCQDIADTVWQDFLDDALARIKLAQNAKLEEVRLSCTTLVSECKTEALQNLADFDARALSTFNIVADKTANAMCADIQNSCSTLMYSDDWKDGMIGIAKDETYQKIIDTCTAIGRDCIITQCNGTSGNFALCQKATDINRREILKNGGVCKQKVLDCISKADNFSDKDTAAIANQIWGTCENNKISVPDTGSTLLSWFATNTGTADAPDNCNATGCNTGFVMVNETCLPAYSGTTSDCGHPDTSINVITVTDNLTNHCKTGVLDLYGNCCTSGKKNSGICVPGTNWQAARLWNLKCTETDPYLCPNKGNMSLYCVTKSTEKSPIVYSATGFDEEQGSDPAYLCGYMGENNNPTYDSQAMWIIVDDKGNYYNANKDTADTAPRPVMYYNKPTDNCPTEDGSDPSLTSCEWKFNNNEWTWGNNCVKPSQNVLIKYVLTNQ